MPHDTQILKMRLVRSKGGVGTILKKPFSPVVEDKVSARKNCREQALVSRVQAFSEKLLGFRSVG
jgi:hypothetical protein